MSSVSSVGTTNKGTTSKIIRPLHEPYINVHYTNHILTSITRIINYTFITRIIYYTSIIRTINYTNHNISFCSPQNVPNLSVLTYPVDNQRYKDCHFVPRSPQCASPYTNPKRQCTSLMNCPQVYRGLPT